MEERPVESPRSTSGSSESSKAGDYTTPFRFTRRMFDRVSRLLRDPAFWIIAIFLFLLVLTIVVPFLIDRAIDDWYREKGLYVE